MLAIKDKGNKAYFVWLKMDDNWNNEERMGIARNIYHFSTPVILFSMGFMISMIAVIAVGIEPCLSPIFHIFCEVCN